MCVFARHITDDLTSLVKQIDVVVANNRKAKMRGFVVFLSDDHETLKPKLIDLAQKHNIKHTPLAIYAGDSAGPRYYKLAKDAEVTVMMWVDRKVKVNHAFAKGELNELSIKKVLASTCKILN